MKFCKKCQAETERYADGVCKPCKKVRVKAWRAANPDKVRASKLAWNRVNQQSVRASREKHYTNNKERVLARNAAWKSRNPEKVATAKAAYVAAHINESRVYQSAYSAANSEKKRAASLAWAAANPEIRRIQHHNRRAKQREVGGKLSPGLFPKLLKLQRGKCACCRADLKRIKPHMDHIISLSAGGPNEDSNMQLLCWPCNLQKSAKHPIDFMQQKGYLL